MRIAILNSFSGDNQKEIDTASAEGREQAAKLVGDLLRSGSAVFLERKVDDETFTYRVTGYDPTTNKLTIRLDSAQQIRDEAIERAPRRRGPWPNHRRRSATISAEAGRTVSVAPRSGG